jgi:hypothetical protein
MKFNNKTITFFLIFLVALLFLGCNEDSSQDLDGDGNETVEDDHLNVSIVETTFINGPEASCEFNTNRTGKTCQIQQNNYINVNIPFDQDWYIELDGEFPRHASGYPRIMHAEGYRLDTFTGDGLSMAFRFANRAINFEEAYNGSISTPAPPNHAGVLEDIIVEGAHVMRIEYFYNESRGKIYWDNVLKGNWLLDIIRIPENVSQISFPYFAGTFKYEVID